MRVRVCTRVYARGCARYIRASVRVRPVPVTYERTVTCVPVRALGISGTRGLTYRTDPGYLWVTGEQATARTPEHLDNPQPPALIHGPGSASR